MNAQTDRQTRVIGALALCVRRVLESGRLRCSYTSGDVCVRVQKWRNLCSTIQSIWMSMP